MIGWLDVVPAARGRGLGADLLGAALWHLADHGASGAILYVDDDAPGGERDRSAANRLIAARAHPVEELAPDYVVASAIPVNPGVPYALACTPSIRDRVGAHRGAGR